MAESSPISRTDCREMVRDEWNWQSEYVAKIRETEWNLAECIDKGHNFVPRTDGGKGETCTRCGYNRR